MGSPILSLIIPVYNKAPFLRRCLDSVAEQMREDVEVIVIDDCSTDGSDKIILEYSEFNRIYLLENGGVSAARNEGLEYAKGKAVAFLDADDALEDGAIEKMLAYAERVDKWPIIQFGQKRLFPDNRVYIKCAEKGSYTVDSLPKYWQMVWNKVYSLEFIRRHAVRFHEGMGFGEDELFNIQLLCKAKKLWHSPHVLYQHWLDDSESICRGGSVDGEKCQKLDAEINKILKSNRSLEVRDWLEARREELRTSRIFKNAGFCTKGTGKRDIVYLLKESEKNEELRYSLRSVDKNFAYRRVWFAGGKPKGLEPDCYMPIKQDAPSKWENVRNMLVEICKNSKISKDFWLFNDDFFILKPCDDSLPQFYNGTLQEQIARCEGQGEYVSRLRHLVETLEDADLPTLNYSVHKPILVNRKKALEVLEKFPNEPMFRALYGNYWKIGGIDEPDCKIRRCDRYIKKGKRFCSTQDDSFEAGIVGRLLRDMFDWPSRFEE